MKKKALLCRLAALALAAVTALPLAACGNVDTSGNVEQKEWIYVPEFRTIEGDNVSYYDMKVIQDNIYYTSWKRNEASGSQSQVLNKYSLVDGQTTAVTMQWKGGSTDYNMSDYLVGEDGSIYSIMYSYEPVPGTEGDFKRICSLCKFDAQGNQIYMEDLTEKMEEQGAYLRSIAADGQGRIYLNVESSVWLYDTEGKYQGAISLESITDGWVNGMGTGKDGKVYLLYYSNTGDRGGYNLVELDYDNKKTGTIYSDFPSYNADQLSIGAEKDFLVFDANRVYEYDLATQTKEAIFEWIDSDINGSNVRSLSVLSDGRLVAIYEDWQENDNGFAILTKTKGDQVPQKENILVATMTAGSDLRSAAVRFNKTNDKYRVNIKEYLNFENLNTEEEYLNAVKDAVTNLNNDITSRNCPDVLDLDGLNVKQLAAKGVFEDLNSFLDQNSNLKRSDLIEKVLEVYTLNDKLVSIPYSFSFQTLVGSKAQLGDKKGWTIEEVMTFSDANPGAMLLDNVTKSELMQYLMMYNEDIFIDWKTGECSFDSDQFKNLLNFVNRFPNELERDNETSTPTKIQNGDVLLDAVYLNRFEDIQIPIEEFKGEVTMIGFPTVDGSSGHSIISSQAYAITSKSKNKDGAWAFIESFLTREEGEKRYRYGFPTIKSKLDAMIEDAITPEYILDENGQPLVDENGEFIVSGGSSSIGYQDGWSYTYRMSTQEDVDMIMGLLETAKPVSYAYGSEVFNIINEEAQPFYQGQKSVDEVANIIQSRVKIYVSENN